MTASRSSGRTVGCRSVTKVTSHKSSGAKRQIVAEWLEEDHPSVITRFVTKPNIANGTGTYHREQSHKQQAD